MLNKILAVLWGLFVLCLSPIVIVWYLVAGLAKGLKIGWDLAIAWFKLAWSFSRDDFVRESDHGPRKR